MTSVTVSPVDFSARSAGCGWRSKSAGFRRQVQRKRCLSGPQRCEMSQRPSWCPGHCTSLGARARPRTRRSGGEHRPRIPDAAEHRKDTDRGRALRATVGPQRPQRGWTDDDDREHVGMRYRSKADGSLVAHRPTAEETARRFLCAGCRVAVYLCTPCDRGQGYCTAGCARTARRGSQRERDRRYQDSQRGRLMHAERSRRYRQRRKSVTEHSPAVSPEHDVCSSATSVAPLPALDDEATTMLARESITAELGSSRQVRCQRCRCWCEPWIRHAPLRRVSGRRGASRRGASRRGGAAPRASSPPNMRPA